MQPDPADFNEDFSAFHAGTLKEQAEYLSDCIRYIRGLYKDQGATAPSAVIVIAHSMGGIAARYMFLQDGFDYGSVKILVTLSTPHTIPPATFDKGVERIYNDINSFWRKEHHSEQGLLNDTLSISIAGGIADTMISSDYADMSSLVPSSHGFSVITTSVPTLFSPVDHQAMMWCDQLRQQIVSALLRSTDVRRADRTRKLDERLTTFHHHLLTGIELLPSKSEPVAAAPFKRRDYEHVNRSLVLSTAERIEDRLYRLDFAEGQGGRVKVAFFGSDVAINYYTCEDVDDQSVCHPVKPRQRVNIPSDNVDPQSPASGSRLSFSVSDVEMPKSAVFCLLQISKGYGSSVQAHVQPPAFRVDTSLLGKPPLVQQRQCQDLLTLLALGMYVFGWRHSTKNMPDSSSGMSWSFGRLDTPLIVYSLSVTANNGKKSWIFAGKYI